MSLRPLFLTPLLLTAAAAQAPPVPGALKVPSATSQQVQLVWTASSGAKSYIVRRSSPAEDAVTITAPDATVTDRTINPYTTYTYCVAAVNDSGTSACSDAVTVGPPPFGFHVLVATTEDTTRFGTLIRMELDGNGDPALAYVNPDPNGDGEEDDNTLYFLSWSRARYAWNEPVKVAVTGAAVSSGPLVPVSLARDAATTGVWGLAFEWEDSVGSRIGLATSSDGGATWKVQSLSGDSHQAVFREPSLALWQGAIYLAFLDVSGFRYVSGQLSDDPAKWTNQPVPLPGGYTQASSTISLALDSEHNPGIAFLAANDASLGAAFWRPGNSAVLAGRNDGWTNQEPDIALSFSGVKPRLVTDAIWNYDLYSQDENHSVWVLAGNGDGAWLPAVNVPADGNISVSAPLTASTGSQGQMAIAMSSIHGGVGDGACGYPKLSRSNDLLTFKTCGPAPVHDPDFAAVGYPAVRYGGNDKLWLAFHNTDTYGAIATGLVLWREP